MVVAVLRTCLTSPGWVSGFVGIALVTVAYPASDPFAANPSWPSWVLVPLALVLGSTWLAAALGAPALLGARGSLLPFLLHVVPQPRWRVAASLLAGWALASLMIQLAALAIAWGIPWAPSPPTSPPPISQAAVAVAATMLLQITVFALLPLLHRMIGTWAAATASLFGLAAAWVLSSAALRAPSLDTAFAPGLLLPVKSLSPGIGAGALMATLLHAACWCSLVVLLLLSLSPHPAGRETI